MAFRPADTSGEAWSVLEKGIREMTPQERIRRAMDLTVMAHRFALAHIRRQYPHEDERRHRMRLAARYIDAETMRKAFGFVADD